MFRSSAVIHRGGRLAANPRAGLASLLTMLVLLASTSRCPAQGYQPAMAQPSYQSSGSTAPANYPPAAFHPSDSFPVEQAAYGQGTKKKDKKPLHHQIAKMPQAEEELEVIHHRSQLVITRSRIVRWFIADPSVIDDRCAAQKIP